ncbi:Transposable element Tc1 transposase [Labeo rohita]|uniref:Transposable element Tc1 transposase n=1 Tax=Labeo rohita TaxID=84645 RepID=A0ABQ8MSG5_LABRO|nr:Transposable element Tc1 transposase [Labeo rohita]
MSYERDVLERQSLSEVKMGRGSPICERVRKKIVEYFKNNVPQRQIAKALQISSSTVHNIIKRFRETGEISVAEDLCWMPVVFRRHCITHQHDSVIDITKWAQKYFQKPLSINTIRRAICRCQLKLYYAKRMSYVNMVQKRRRVLWAKAHLNWTVSKWKSDLWSDESKSDILVGNHEHCVLRAEEEGDLCTCYQHSVITRSKVRNSNTKTPEMLHHGKHAPVTTILRPVAGIKFEMSSFCA